MMGQTIRLVLNETDEILSYVSVGSMEGTVEYTGELPVGFKANFKPLFYKLNNGEITRNEDYVTPEPPKVAPVLTDQDKINAHFFKTQIKLQKQLSEMGTSRNG